MASPLRNNIRLPAVAAQGTPVYPQPRANSFFVPIDERLLFTLVQEVFTCQLCHATTSLCDNMKRHLHYAHEITLNPVQHRVRRASLPALLPVLPPETPIIVSTRPTARFEDMISDFRCDDIKTPIKPFPSASRSQRVRLHECEIEQCHVVYSSWKDLEKHMKFSHRSFYNEVNKRASSGDNPSAKRPR